MNNDLKEFIRQLKELAEGWGMTLSEVVEMIDSYKDPEVDIPPENVVISLRNEDGDDTVDFYVENLQGQRFNSFAVYNVDFDPDGDGAVRIRKLVPGPALAARGGWMYRAAGRRIGGFASRAQYLSQKHFDEAGSNLLFSLVLDKNDSIDLEDVRLHGVNSSDGAFRQLVTETVDAEYRD